LWKYGTLVKQKAMHFWSFILCRDCIHYIPLRSGC
jgi:hypothetical protein